MSCNCGLNELFTEDVSRRDARKYRRRGLDVRGRRLLRALEQKVTLTGSSTLEIGMGSGAFTIEMLKRGADHAIGVDAVPNQLAYARQLAGEFGVAEKLELHQGDFTQIHSHVPPAEIVVLDRVVCCYPDWRSLLGAAAERAQSVIVMSYPRQAWFTRIWVRASNLAMIVLRKSFRLHLHPPAAMHELLRSYGLQPRVVGYRGGWELLLASR